MIIVVVYDDNGSVLLNYAVLWKDHYDSTDHDNDDNIINNDDDDNDEW